jgi:hypothetical protein
MTQPEFKHTLGCFELRIYENAMVDLYRSYTAVVINMKTQEHFTQVIKVSHLVFLSDKKDYDPIKDICEKGNKLLQEKYNEYMIDQIILGGEDA